MTVSSSPEYYIIKGKDFLYRFNRYYGGFENLEKNSIELLKARTKFGIWRPFGGTDGMIKSKWVMTEDSSWNKSENYDKISTRVYTSELTENENEIVIYAKQSLSPLSKMPLIRMDVEYRIRADGEIEVISSNHVREDATFLPRFGFELELDGHIDNMEYYANGPDENYPDLCHNIRKGLFRSKIDKDYVQKAFPQEQGNHTCAKFFSIADDSGNGITFLCDEEKEFQFRATHHSIDDINRARHYCELKNKDISYLRIDYKVSGVGSSALQDKYKFSEKDFVFRFSMKPFTNQKRR
jgi:beta-galactosidase